MANEIVYSGHGNLRLSAIMILHVIMALLFDSVDLRQFVTFKGSINGAGSLANKIPQVNWGDAMSAPSEGSAVANTDLTDSAVTITVAHQALRREITDHMLVTGSAPSLEALAQNMAIAFRLRFTDLTASLFSSVTAQVNSSGAAMTVDDFFDAKAALRTAFVPGPHVLVLHQKNFNDLISDLRGETGPIAEFRETNEAIMGASIGSGIMGTMLNTVVVGSDSVPTSGGDYVNCMFGFGAFGWNAAAPPIEQLKQGINPIVAHPDFPLYIEFDRTADTVLSGVQGNAFIGVGILENARGVRLINVQ